MIETPQDFQKFREENTEGDLFLHVVTDTTTLHPVWDRVCILFIRNLSTARTYYISFDHPDSTPLIGPSSFHHELEHMPNRKWVLDKKAFTQSLLLTNLHDANLASSLKNNTTIDLSEYDTPAHTLVQNNSNEFPQVNRAVPLMKHLEVFDDLADDVGRLLKGYEPDVAFRRINTLVIDTLGAMEREGIFVDRQKFIEHYEIDPGESGIVNSQYNVYTSTGRPSNRFGGVNYAALNQSDGSRSCFRSRYGKHGKIIVVDYATFHPRIICYLTNYPIPADIDIYEYLAKLYFQKKQIDETDIANSKKLTFRQFFGGVEDKYLHIKYLANLNTYINDQWEFFKKNEYVCTPLFKRKITKHHIEEPNPPKLFNYILQATEGEIAIPKIQSVQTLLKDRKTTAVLYTYDSIMFDFHQEDGIDTLRQILKIMSFDGVFPLKTYMGETYQDVKQVSL